MNRPNDRSTLREGCLIRHVPYVGIVYRIARWDSGNDEAEVTCVWAYGKQRAACYPNTSMRPDLWGKVGSAGWVVLEEAEEAAFALGGDESMWW